MPRKRLTPANPFYLASEAEAVPQTARRAPIADVAGDASATAALRELSDSMAEARAAGRMVLDLPLGDIVLDHLVRDRVSVDEAELETLCASIRARGQQTPIEVMALADGRYGLISGWRRCRAIARLAETGAHSGSVLALLRRPEDASEAYLSMVEENEIRVGLSYFERARIALKSVEGGVFETHKAALLALFASASRAKRSKIRSFLGLVQALDGHLRFPAALGERLGLALAKQLDDDPGLAGVLCGRLQSEPSPTPEAEQALLQAVLRDRTRAAPRSGTTPSPRDHQVAAGLRVRVHGDMERIEITGRKLDAALCDRLLAWLAETEN